MRISGGVRASRSLDVAAVAILLLVAAAAGVLGSQSLRLGLGFILACLGVAVVASRPVLIAVLALPALYGYQSLGLGPSVGLSDLLLMAAALLALPALSRSRAFRDVAPLTRAFLIYLALLAPSLILQPTAAAWQEVLHRVVIVLGGVLVGAWVVQEDRATQALRLLLAATVFFAVASVLTWLTNGQQPAYPFGYHKNYVGALIALTLMILLCAGEHLRLALPLRLSAGFLLIAGLFACQSRGSILGAALGGFVWLFAPRGSGQVAGRTRLLAAVLAFGFAIYAGLSVQDQLRSGDVETNSIGVRRNVEAFTRELWRTSPLDGVGLRYFNSGDYGLLAQPSNNAINNELAEAGLSGAAGFVVLHGVVLTMLWRRRRQALGLAALALLSGQLLHGMFDIYWSSGVTPLPFIVTGMALASATASVPRSAADKAPERIA